MKNWSFPGRCIKSSGERSIHIGKAYFFGSVQLQVSERIKSGRIFKVLFPSVGAVNGWASLIKLLQDFYKLERSSQVRRMVGKEETTGIELLQPQCWEVGGKRSFADVVKGAGFYGDGTCEIKQVGRNRHIEVGEEGVQERNDLLGKSLVIGFISQNDEVFTTANVSEFLRWVEKNWVINRNFGFEDLGDGRWLLVWPSFQEAMRIKELVHLRFKSFRLDLKIWDEGLYHPCSLSGDEWILVTGIPIQLKSVNLLRALGEFFGKLIGIDWASWSLPFVRIRVSTTLGIPEEIPIVFRSQQFIIRVFIPRHGD
ncbi:unnamed protein product [Linum trigynum]|uniref:DUF4283 domain-containing protein n=1 Tax=Linum trigynum TaxID=586398 RepID=A0AAV2F6D7_9ROSI